MKTLIVETSRTGHEVYVSDGARVLHLGPISPSRAATPIDAIPIAIYRAEVHGHKVSHDVELRTFPRTV